MWEAPNIWKNWSTLGMYIYMQIKLIVVVDVVEKRSRKECQKHNPAMIGNIFFLIETH